MVSALARRMGASNRTIGRYLIAAMALGIAPLVAVGIELSAIENAKGW